MSVTTPNGAVELRAGDQIGGWTVVGLVGSGGSASVYRARPTDLSYDDPAYPASQGGSVYPASQDGSVYPASQDGSVYPASQDGSVDTVALRICRPTDQRHLEAIVATYEHTPVHPNVITVYDTFVHRSQGHEHVVSITELSEDGTLEEQLANSSLAASEARILADHLIRGLHAYHRTGEVHGDVKPSNIMRFGDRWKLVDPSATEHRAGSTTSVVTHERTLRYVAPEALDTPGRTRRAGDVWALGVTLHEALTGAPPFDSMADQVVANCQIDPSVPQDLGHLIETCVAPFESRVKTAGSLLDLPSTASAVRSSPGRRVMLSVAVIAVVVAVGLMASMLWPRATNNDDSASAVTSEPNPTSNQQESGAEQTALLVPATSEPASSTNSATSIPSEGAAESVPGIASDSSWQGQVGSNFEDDGEVIAARFVPVDGGPTPTVRVDAEGNARLEVGSTNRSDTYYLTVEEIQEPALAGTEVLVQADVRMVYYAGGEFGIDGPVHSFVLKAIPSDASASDAYVVSVVPTDQGMRLRVGVTEGGVAGSEEYQYRGPNDGHTAMAERMVFPSVITDTAAGDTAIGDTAEPGSTVELGYWPLSARLLASDDAVRIAVELTNPNGGTETLEWVDTESGRYGGPGPVGLATYGVWSIEPRFDNLLISGG